MNKLSLEVSDGLHELARILTEYVHEPRMLEPEDAAVLVACCKELRAGARALENQLSQRMWNEEARKDRLAHARGLVEAVTRKGSNVTLFPVVPRPVPEGVHA